MNTATHTKTARNLTTFAAKRKARRFAMQGLYEWQINNKDIADIQAYTRAENAMHKVDIVYYTELMKNISADTQSLDEHFLPFVDRNIHGVVELAILRVGTYELANHLEIPYKVVLDEAIELAKDFGATDSHKYINGVLDKVAAVLRKAEVNAEPKS